MTGITDDHIGLIRSKSKDILKEAISTRRHLHRYPELSFKEYNTSDYIADYLNRLDIPFVRGIAGTGIIATIAGEMGSGPAIGLRAELDALPVTENNQSEYKSASNGVMHACGHDAHMAMLLASASILRSMTGSFRGKFILIFQPGEELVPGGASLIIKEGTLGRIKPAAIIAQHLLPELDSGKVGFKAGRYMASSDEIYIDIKGTGGHAALPGQSTDQVLIASDLVCRLKENVRQRSGDLPLVLGIGKLIADGATNVVPEKVHIEGTLRTFDEEIRSENHNAIIETCQAVADQYSVSITPEIRKGYPVLVNDSLLTSRAQSLAERLHGKDNVEELSLRMSSEDFAFYSIEYPVLFYRLGVKKEGTTPRNLHTPDFEMDEAAMETGILTLCALAVDLVNSL